MDEKNEYEEGVNAYNNMTDYEKNAFKNLIELNNLIEIMKLYFISSNYKYQIWDVFQTLWSIRHARKNIIQEKKENLSIVEI